MASCVKTKTHEQSHHRFAETFRHSLREWLYGLFRALPGEPGFLATIAGAMRKHRRQLDISVGISGPHDFAVRDRRIRPKRRSRPSHPASTFVTIAIRPSY
jgi:hypothetical protein